MTDFIRDDSKSLFSITASGQKVEQFNAAGRLLCIKRVSKDGEKINEYYNPHNIELIQSDYEDLDSKSYSRIVHKPAQLAEAMKAGIAWGEAVPEKYDLGLQDVKEQIIGETGLESLELFTDERSLNAKIAVTLSFMRMGDCIQGLFSKNKRSYDVLAKDQAKKLKEIYCLR